MLVINCIAMSVISYLAMSVIIYILEIMPAINYITVGY